ncbi:MAG: carboxypeptidase regulatory-like domain-containing protein [Pyrinomonadaceae bacterium]
MFRKLVFTIIAAMALVVSASGIASAQVGELHGHVFMQQADGTKVPLADAVIDVFRTDIASKYNTKTNKKGEWVFAGIPYIGTYIVAVSHPTAQPTWQPNVKAGRDVDVVLTVSSGDGKRLTIDEIKGLSAGAPAASGSGGSESASDKAKREEAARKIAEIEAKNKKIEEANITVETTFKAGNAALEAKNYDEAIRQYDAGLVADPEQPMIWANRSVALKARGIVRYNAGIAATDDAQKKTGLEGARADFRAAAEGMNKSVELIKAQPVPADPAQHEINRLFALATRAESMRLFVTKVDQSQADAGKTAYEEYIAVETEPVKKAKAQHDLAQMLFDANSFEPALAEYKKILAVTPDDTDALVKSGMLLFNIGAMENNDKVKYQEAANYLQQFVDKAPDTDKLKADAKAILEELKNQQNVKAEKTAAPARRRRP